MNGKKYIVLEKDGLSGLTVGSHVVKNGQTFFSSQWKWGDEALDLAIADGRCEEVVEKKPAKKSKGGAE